MIEMQVLAAICACLTSVSFGANNTITSAVIYTFQKDSDDQIKMSLEEASWLRKRKAILVYGLPQSTLDLTELSLKNI